jgi:hypothetical protein
MSIPKAVRVIRSASRVDFSLAFFSAVLGVLVTALLSAQSGPAPEWLLFLGIVVLLATVSVLVVKIGDIQRTIFDLTEKATGGVRFVDKDDISALGADQVMHASVVRVLGTARQDMLASNSAAQSYVRATERRLRRRQPFVYRRITSDRLRPALMDHFTSLLDASEASSSSSVEIAVMPNIECAVFYQVFDDHAVLVMVDNPTVPHASDYSFAFISAEPAFVNAFVAHFDRAWRRLAPIRNKSDLERMVDVLH